MARARDTGQVFLDALISAHKLGGRLCFLQLDGLHSCRQGLTGDVMIPLSPRLLYTQEAALCPEAGATT